MELVKKVVQETTYTIELTEKELAEIVECMGNTNDLQGYSEFKALQNILKGEI